MYVVCISVCMHACMCVCEQTRFISIQVHLHVRVLDYMRLIMKIKT